MKRKAEKRQDTAPVSALSAVAARRARQQKLQSTEQSIEDKESRSEGERPPKRTRSIASNTNDDDEAKDRSDSAVRYPRRQNGNVTGKTRTEKSTGRADEQLVIGDTGSSDSGPEFEENLSVISEIAEEDNSSLEGQEGEDVPELAPQPPTEGFPLSKIRLNKANVVYSDESVLCVRLKEKLTLVLTGVYDIWVKRGVISLMGSKLHASPNLYRVYAPSTHSLPVIKYVSGTEGYAEVEIRSSRTGIGGLGELSALYSRIWNEGATEADKAVTKELPKRSFSLLYTSSDDPLNRHLRPLHLDKKWSAAMKVLSQRGHRLRVLVCGPKGSGKSTFSRYLLNHILSPAPVAEGGHVFPDGLAFLDLDPGQPEFSPMGSIYLAHMRNPVFGPPFSHPSLYDANMGKIVRSHNIGSSSPKDDPDHYAAVAMNLMDHYRELLTTYPHCPLIVNYPGWIFGQGLEVVTWFIRSLGLSDVVYMSEKGPEEVVQPLGYTCSEIGVPLTILPSQPVDFVSRSSAQLRSMQMQSYFHKAHPEGCPNPIWNDVPMTRVTPTLVDYAGEQQGILGILVTGNQHDPSLLHDIIEGALVAVVAIDDIRAFPGLKIAVHAEPDQEVQNVGPGDDMDEDMSDAVPEPHQPPSATSPEYTITRTVTEDLPCISVGAGVCATLDPAASHCIGLAFIRAVNIKSKKLELVTPIPPTTMKDAVENSHGLLLVRGQLDNPNWAISEEYHAARAAEKRHLDWMAERRKRKQQTATENSSAEVADLEHEEMSDLEDPVEKLARLRARVRNASNVPWMTVVDDSGQQTMLDRQRDKKALWKLRKKAYVGSESETDW